MTRLGDLAQRVAARRARHRRTVGGPPREIVPAAPEDAPAAAGPAAAAADPFDAARERLRARIPPPPDED